MNKNLSRVTIFTSASERIGAYLSNQNTRNIKEPSTQDVSE